MENQLFISDSDFKRFIENVINVFPVIAPVANQQKFSFDVLQSASDLRLDYDVTILPPKKVFFPPTQALIRFDGSKAISCINPKPAVLLGVHFYDIKAIDMLDELFRAPIEDRNYMANREATTIIGSNIQSVNPRSFYSSASQSLSPTGHDGFLTKIKRGYLYEIFTAKGKALIAFGNFIEAVAEQVIEAEEVNHKAYTRAPEKLPLQRSDLSKAVRATFSNDNIWEKLADKCFACGACNLVCPTCYCFDVQDEWGLDQTTCIRCRHWDGCMLNQFSEITLGGGKKENFRATPGQRMRHRIMRKTSYLNDRLGDQACVGCGRCSIACVPDIADPVKIIEVLLSQSEVAGG